MSDFNINCKRINDNNSNRCIFCGSKAGHYCALTNSIKNEVQKCEVDNG